MTWKEKCTSKHIEQRHILINQTSNFKLVSNYFDMVALVHGGMSDDSENKNVIIVELRAEVVMQKHWVPSNGQLPNAGVSLLWRVLEDNGSRTWIKELEVMKKFKRDVQVLHG
jgi:hypothetical protein